MYILSPVVLAVSSGCSYLDTILKKGKNPVKIPKLTQRQLPVVFFQFLAYTVLNVGPLKLF